jgi:hypothetical protein
VIPKVQNNGWQKIKKFIVRTRWGEDATGTTQKPENNPNWWI